MSNFRSLKEVAKELNVKPYRIQYVIASGNIEEPGMMMGRRCFQDKHVEELREYFAKERYGNGKLVSNRKKKEE